MSPSATLSLQWLDSDDKIIDGEKFSISGIQGPSNKVMLTSRLLFDRLLTSHTGVYKCVSFLTIPGTDVYNYSVNETIRVSVESKFCMTL
jgi:hypothetical protein